jgi:hypothetical protein
MEMRDPSIRASAARFAYLISRKPLVENYVPFVGSTEAAKDVVARVGVVGPKQVG